MSVHNTTSTRWLRVTTDVLTRGGGMVLLFNDATLARGRGLPLYLLVWMYVGWLMWFGIWIELSVDEACVPEPVEG